MAVSRRHWFGVGCFERIMNVLLNFIKPTELRSASMVSVKSALQIGAFMAPAIIILMIVLAYVGYAEQKSSLALLEGGWASTEVQLKKATQASRELKTRKNALDELRNWQESRIPWPGVLNDLRKQVPPEIQLTVMQARQAFEVTTNGIPQRSVRVLLNGRCEGPEAENRVEALRTSLASDGLLGDLVARARVTSFQEDADPASSTDDRVFQIELDFAPRRIHATAAE